jgi:hypothetical protein
MRRLKISLAFAACLAGYAGAAAAQETAPDVKAQNAQNLAGCVQQGIASNPAPFMSGNADDGNAAITLLLRECIAETLHREISSVPESDDGLTAILNENFDRATFEARMSAPAP